MECGGREPNFSSYAARASWPPVSAAPVLSYTASDMYNNVLFSSSWGCKAALTIDSSRLCRILNAPPRTFPTPTPRRDAGFKVVKPHVFNRAHRLLSEQRCAHIVPPTHLPRVGRPPPESAHVLPPESVVAP